MGGEAQAEAFARDLLVRQGICLPGGEVRRHPVTGGDTSAAFRLEGSRGSFFVKWAESAKADVLAAEAEGLRALGEALQAAVPPEGEDGAPPCGVPRVLASGFQGGSGVAVLILAWIDAGPKDEKAAALLGRCLGELHRETARSSPRRYGFFRDTYIGGLRQPNAWGESWPEFYGTRRLLPLIAAAGRRGVMPPSRRRRLEHLLKRLPELLPAHPPASLLHGDLWSGNWLADLSGRVYLVDPAVFFGDREHDLAMVRLFGGFPPSFFAAYADAYPLDPGFVEREPLYRLYYLLVHLVLFGETYGPAVDRILRTYA
ncbi:MAG: fructosamine kinase family protein [Brockia lithotrophica]|nr:fructosamine kinase family protein [Brockia lithotrophica]